MCDQALNERILPGRARRGHDLFGAETLQEATEVCSVHVVSVPQQIRRCGVGWEGFADLLPRPRRCRMVGRVEMDDTPPVV